MVGVLDPRARVASKQRDLVFVAWGAVAGRSEEIAAALGGEARCFFPQGTRVRPPVVLRWVLSAVGTAWYLLTRRPRAVIVTNPPIFAPLVVLACARLIGARVLMDSHPGGFGVQGDRVAGRVQPIHRLLMPRVDLVLVTEEGWSETVEARGGRAAIVHEAPAGWVLTPPSRHERLRVLVIGRFGGDEPVAQVLEAAGALPDCDFALTGDPSQLRDGLRDAAPGNVEFVGFLGPDAYRAAVVDCDAVLTLTTEPSSVMRAACEAVYAGRPVVVSDWPAGRELFPFGIHTANEGPAIARAIATLDADYDTYAAGVADARRLQQERWDRQLAVLVTAVGG